MYLENLIDFTLAFKFCIWYNMSILYAEVIYMTNKEIAKSLIDQIPDYKIKYVISFLQGFKLDDDVEDDLFCKQMVNDYLNDTDPEKDESITIEELAKNLGIELS